MLMLFFILWVATFVGIGGGMVMTYGWPKSTAEEFKTLAQVFFGSLLGAVLYTGLIAFFIVLFGVAA